MADLKIQDAPIATAANLTDRIPASQGDALAKVITVQQIVDKVTGFAPALTADENYVTDAEKAALHGVNDPNSSSATAAQGLLADNALQPGDQVAVGTVSTFYLDAGTAISDNQYLSPSPSNYPQEVDSALVASATNGGVGFLERFITAPLGVTSIPAGTWAFHNYCYASSLTGNNKIITRINRRCEQVGMTGTFTGTGATRTFTVTGGSPFVAGDANTSILLASLIETPTQTAWISGFTSSSVVTVTLTDAEFVNTVGVPLSAIYYLIFNTQTETRDITSTSLAVPHDATFEVVRATPTTVTPTDRLVAAYFAYTDQASNRTIYLLHGGSANYSRIETPLLGNLITQTITNGATTTAPSEDTVFDALTGKMAVVTPGTLGNVLTSTGTAWTSAAPAVQDLSGKQNVLVSGTNIKTIGGVSILGSGDVPAGGGGAVVVQALGVKSVDFTVDRLNGEYATVTTGTAAVAMTLTSPASATNSYRMSVAIQQGATARTVTLKGTDANVISSGGLMSSGDALPNSGANTLDIFTFEWNGAKWETIDARFDVKA